MDGGSVRVATLDHLVLTVADPEVTAAWYVRVLGMTQAEFRPADGSTRIALTFGTQKINLHRAGAEWEPKAAHPGPGTADLCFLSHDPLGRWLAHLDALGIAVELGPVARSGATGPITSLYLRDPDGNLVEVSERG
ncbi:Catechol 2,3-dioxygenase [Jannaschia faecimaris]|uniref:Catechol 2,3-dioxygenase n=1 Tax=Jannaschia faecimaris TaxID=1244108 RepID=A0A1H3LT12_9RHOB|nr:VOC family protein [Jannaschia faecimaris]SDY67118.1 Catechol 2,3-dioxygenase [Jannaschia faecimaris]